MRGEWVDAAYVFDGFIASRMDVLHRAMRVRLRAMAEALGVPAKHLELVMIIASAEADTAGEIAKQLGVSRSLLSKNVEEAVRAGYIETAQDPADRRVVLPASQECRYGERRLCRFSPFRRSVRGKFAFAM